MRRTHLALWAPPLVLAATAALLSQARGPFYQGQWTDPDYCYLLSALTVAEGSSPHHVDHPGTPVQVLGAAVLRTVDLLPARPAGGSLRTRVLRDPERHLAAFGAALVLACCAMLYGAGHAVWRATGRLPEALLCQLGPLLSLQTLVLSCRVLPEPLLATLGAGLGAVVVCALATGGERRAASALGVLLGLGIATKFPFAVLAIVPLVALETWRGRARVAVAAGVTLALALLPVWSQLPRMLEWLVAIARHTGHYGSGSQSVVEWSEFGSNLGSLPREEPLMFALAAGSLVLAGLLARSGHGRGRWVRTLLAIAGAQVLLTILVAKHPRPHYLITGSSIAGASLAIGLRLARELQPEGLRRCARIVGVVLVLLTVGWNVTSVRSTLSGIAAWKESLEPAIALGPDTRLVHGILNPSPAAALQFGNFYAAGRYAVELRALYPGFVIWDWLGLHHFGRPVPLRDHLEDAGSPRPSFRYLARTSLSPRTLGGGGAEWSRTELSPFGLEALYRVHPTPAGVATTGAFRGFFDVAGLDAREGAHEVRRGRGPATTAWFCSDAGPRRLALAARGEHPGGVTARLVLDGQPLAELDLPAAGFSKHSVPFAASPGVHELRVAYFSRSGAALGENEAAVLFRRLTID